MLGDVRLERDIQQCNKCGKWRALQDEVLDIKRSGYSPGVRKLLSKAGADLCFDEASEHLHEFAGLRVTDKEIERITEGIGQEISNEDDEAVRVQMSGDPPMSEEMPAKLYIACDGTGVPVLKKETEGRQGKGESGEAKTREAKLGCVFTQTACTSEGEPIRDAGSTSYVGRIETAEQFGNRIYAEAQRLGLENAGQVIFLGDGATWIWNLAEQHFPKAIQILDFYHAREHLEALSRLLHPEDQSAREMFSSSLVGKLRQGLILDIIAELKNLELSGKKRKERDREVEYFEKNQSRMRYNEFREAGLFIGSGAIEAGCKSVIAHRLKQSGMRWSVRGANTIIALRCRIKSARFEDYWEQRLAA